MDDRERFVNTVLGKPVDRPPYYLFWGPWRTTHERWVREGMDPSVNDPRTLFPSDMRPKVVQVEYGPFPKYARDVLSSDGRTEEFVDPWGVQRRDLVVGETMPMFLSHPVKSRGDWERYRDERLSLDGNVFQGRFAGGWLEDALAWQGRGGPLQIGDYPDVGLFGCARWLMGDVDLLIAFASDPELVHDILGHLADLYLAVFERVVSRVDVDVIHIWEDMCGKQGPLISPRMWREFLGPHYRRFRDFADSHGIPVLSCDTDGNPSLLMEPMMEAGVNFLWPMEVAAGCDINEYVERYPSMAFLGGIDKRALALGPPEIDAELERVMPAIGNGRYIPELDHNIPEDVSWDNYRYYVKRLREILGVS